MSFLRDIATGIGPVPGVAALVARARAEEDSVAVPLQPFARITHEGAAAHRGRDLDHRGSDPAME
jgi:hypothetical protein